MNEKTLERKCCKWAESQGWLVLKLVCPNVRGVPDRMFLRDGEAMFVEFKQPGGKTRPEQERMIEKLNKHGFGCVVVDRFDNFVDWMGSE